LFPPYYAFKQIHRTLRKQGEGIYWREYRDPEAARRLLSVALTSSDPIVKKFAYNLKSFMLAACLISKADQTASNGAKVERPQCHIARAVFG
jgi:hypothetical protein